MSELRVTTLKHAAAAVDNITLDANGSTAVAGTLTLQNAGFDSRITLQNTGTGGQTFNIFSTNDSFTQGGGNLMFHTPTATNGILKMDSAGRVTIPYQPSFYAQHNATSSASGSYGNFTDEYINIGNHVSHSTHGGAYSYTRFTCPVAGIYLVWAGTIGPNAATVQRSYIYKNGVIASAVLRSSQDGNHGTSASMTVLVNASAGDWIAASSLSDNGAVGFYAGEYSHFGVRLLG
jgi:hypothetical protein